MSKPSEQSLINTEKPKFIDVTGNMIVPPKMEKTSKINVEKDKNNRYDS